MQHTAPDISQWEKDCIAELAMGKDAHESDIFHRIALLANIIGHEHVGLGLAYPNSVNTPYFSFFCTYPTDWRAKYVDVSQEHFNSTTATGKRTLDIYGAPSTWEAEEFYAEAAVNNIGLSHIFTSSREGNSKALFGLTTSNMQGWTPDHATILACTSIEAISPVLIKKHLSWASIKLTSEEIIYLRLVLDGIKTARIAEVMGQAESHIDTMRSRILKYFPRGSIASAAFFAFQLGLIPTTQLNTSSAVDISNYHNLSLLRRQRDRGK